ncbi:hypothetical protein [Streptomyces ziwulingensis]|uniref:PRL2-23 n=1 Tax=Streptomyces ziwulingensis TaxID=1045501 RepID=A0ABP9D0A0_9ACTN
MGAAIVAAMAALAGVFLQAFIGDWRTRSERRRRELRDAILNVLGAFVRFREKQFEKVEACRTENESVVAALRPARWEARSALTTAIDELHATTADQRLLDVAETARLLAIEIGDAATPGRVDDAKVAEVGRRAREVHTELRQAAHRTLNH